MKRLKAVVNHVPRQIIKLAVVFDVLNILDAALTQAAGIKGTLYEAIPLMRLCIEHSWGLFWLVKIGSILICTLVLLLLARKYPGQIRKIFIGLVIAMAGVCVINMIGVI